MTRAPVDVSLYHVTDTPLSSERGLVETAKVYVAEAIAAAGRLHVGRAHGPAHHFHNRW